MTEPSIRFAVIGINHNHIFGQVNLLLRAGAEFVSFFAPEPDLAERFGLLFSDVRKACGEEEILEDPSVTLVVSAGIPCERAPLGVRVMQHDKDYMTDKPGFTTLEQLAEVRRVQAETRRIYSICFSERLENPATVKAGELVAAGAVGKVVQTVGFGPHRIDAHSRPEWFFQKDKYGGILTDIASHQADQFLFFTGSTQAEVVASQVANYHFPQYPELEDFGEMLLRGDGGSGYVRVDWYTPQGLPVWGDGRLTILGTEGYIELRKYVDIAGRAGGDHLFLVNDEDVRYIDCSEVELPYGRQLIQDILNRTGTAMPQEHVFLASQLALEAEASAVRLGNLRHE
jgi:predicted dehydrogenase